MCDQLKINSFRGFEDYLKQLGKRFFPYGNATHAFVDILLYLNKTEKLEKPNIIMPAFIPAKLYRIILACGYTPKFYEINSQCRFNYEEIENLIDSNTKGIFAVHYFGYPADMVTLKQLAEHKNLPLIEDCAHVLYGDIDGTLLGRFGNVSIFSVRKMLVLSDGGYLVINKDFDSFSPTYKNKVSSIYTLSKFIQSRGKNIYFNLTEGNDIFHLAKIPSKGYIDLTRTNKINLKSISSFSSYYAQTTNINKHVQLRKENYNLLFDALKNFSFLQPVYNELPTNWTPYSFPVLITEGNRNELQLELVKSGISCGSGWPESPFDNHLIKTLELSKNIIEFPVHPFVTYKQFDNIVRACESFKKNISKKIFQSYQSEIYNKHSIAIHELQDANKILNDDVRTSLKIRIISSNEEFDKLKSEWNELCMNSTSHVFQTFEWQRLWWKHYGQDKQLFIILFYDQNKLIAISPFFFDTFKINRLNVFRRLRLIGTSIESDAENKSSSGYGASDYLDLIILPGYENSASENLVNYLFEYPDLYHTIQFDEISNDSNIFKFLLPILSEQECAHKISKRDICPRILVPGTLAEYMKCLSSKIRYQLTKIKKDINDPSLFLVKKVQSVQDLGREFDNFVRLHQQRWNAQGLPGAFVDSRYKKFLQEAVSELLRSGLLHFTSAYSGNNCVAVECAFKYKDYFYDYLKAFDDRSHLAKYRPGRALLLLLIEEAINNNSKVVDLLRGGEPYKFEIATEWHWIYKISIDNPAYNYRVRSSLFYTIIFLYQLKYHIAKEFHVMKVQLSNYGLTGFTKHYLPTTLKKLKSKFFESEPLNRKAAAANNISSKKVKTSKVTLNDRVHELR